jgi:hypothetical protein
LEKTQNISDLDSNLNPDLDRDPRFNNGSVVSVGPIFRPQGIKAIKFCYLRGLLYLHILCYLQPPTAFVEGKVGLKRILPTRTEGDADYEPAVI